MAPMVHSPDRCSVVAGAVRLQRHGPRDADGDAVDGYLSRVPGGVGVGVAADRQCQDHVEDHVGEHHGRSRESGESQRGAGRIGRRQQANYTTAVVTVDYSSAAIVYDDGSANGMALTPVGANGQKLGQVQLTLTLDPAQTLSVAIGKVSRLALLDFKLAASNRRPIRRRRR